MQVFFRTRLNGKQPFILSKCTESPKDWSILIWAEFALLHKENTLFVEVKCKN